MGKKRRKKDSSVKTLLLILTAVVVMVAAIYVVSKVLGKISSDYENIEFTKEETSTISIEIEDEPKSGWDESDEGWRYYLKKNQYVTEQWKEIDGFLYYFDEDGILATGEWKQDGQIYTCQETKGYLKDIQTDLDYVPESTGENLDSLARTNAFWCYLDDKDTGTSPFKTILFRKTVENKVKPLGQETNPERTTKNSMRAYGDYVYFLPKVKESAMSGLSESDKELCDKLFRMIPGTDKKELIAEDVDGYIVLDGIIYYAQDGKIQSTKSGTEYVSGDDRYSVIVKQDDCYLVDEKGNPVAAEGGDTVSIGDRIYRIEDDGRIKDVSHGQEIISGKMLHLSGSGLKAMVVSKGDTGEKILIKELYGVQSYCIVDNQIYYSAYVDKGSDTEWYSQIFRTDMSGADKSAVSGRFPGSMEQMYYYESAGEIYGEYHPSIWKQGYGVAAAIKMDGTIYQINDENARTGKYVNGNDMLELVMAKDGKLTCLWQDCEWKRSSGLSSVLWSKAIELDAGNRSLVEEVADTQKESTQAPQVGDVIEPIGGTPSGGKPVETISPGQASINDNPIVSTEGPEKETQAPVQTIPPVKEMENQVIITPLG